MRAVADAGPLIHLSWIDHLFLLRRLFDEIAVPIGVRDEVLASPEGTPGLERLHAAFAEGWLLVHATEPVAPDAPLGIGETEALLLAQRLDQALLLTDDAGARAEALRRGLVVTGTLGLLIQALRQGIIPSALPLAIELRRLGQWISPALLKVVEDEERR